MTLHESRPESAAVAVVTTKTGAAEYRIVATTTIESPAGKVWALLQDWEKFLAVGLPGFASDFEWLTGGPTQVPSTFQFTVTDTPIKEEIYERSAGEEEGEYRLRYRVLEPALGILEYDAILELRRLSDTRTAFSAVRDVRLEPGTGPDQLAGIVELETQHLREHFA